MLLEAELLWRNHGGISWKVFGTTIVVKFLVFVFFWRIFSGCRNIGNVISKRLLLLLFYRWFMELFRRQLKRRWKNNLLIQWLRYSSPVRSLLSSFDLNQLSLHNLNVSGVPSPVSALATLMATSLSSTQILSQPSNASKLTLAVWLTSQSPETLWSPVASLPSRTN